MLNQNNMPGAGSISDTMEFMRKMWGSMGTPAIGIPSLSVEEINKKISDLKTVASWLELNMNMLRATIQTLEVQSATLTTLQAMGAILSTREGEGAAAAKAGSPFGFPTWPPQGKPAAESAPARAPEPEPEPEPEVEPEETAQPQAAAPSASGDKPDPAAPDFQASMANPTAWWNLLQEQFQQAVGNVLADQPPAGKDIKTPSPAAQKKTTKAKPAAKPRTRAKSTVVQSGKPKPASRKPKSP
ncbi:MULTISPECIES: PhaM family polyhydroxyalkanoate granule multifunctional regulatory protein [unclassified Herbaspirillum]|uniref:PhaM family polyhydroxyalkanoate granule multifunctional regulatory protein n=1 Tax=unclassified Herbaspirillum TaxID=2624150 RepID=UPI000E2ED790|nr:MULTISPECIES: PhaM family polyhydroxyalkanoate granule multifunctional regulatory protein [unclassified Herbaspirillum]RFB70968.1 pilus assembly protein FimV [Herbaspirillum sp. 3R-3a1]TFI08507.1 pilus assembly protein FimV [Herbaspirillum sp. 3R11]TFI14921.1 pilus assembly protein FimV [Herbaspirillum sp. 3R-11]TFI19813.1 pilus assembly protein FimV [Herbaspirillum sp. 3C11]